MSEINLNTLKSLLLNNHLSENNLVEIVKNISKNFTTDRDKISIYVNDKDFVSAYCYFYLPTNIPKYSFLYNKILPQTQQLISQCHFVDFGTGPGTYLFAFRKLSQALSYTGIDSSELMLEQAKNVLSHFYPQENFQFLNNINQLKLEGDIYLNFGNSLNELSTQDVINIIKKLKPKFLSFIEPGTSEVFEKVIEIREKLNNFSYHSHYPCSNISYSCPIFQKKNSGQMDWCHQVLRLKHGPDIERFSQLVKLDRKAMPLIAHFYSLEEPMKREEEVIVRYLRETKFSFDYQTCVESDSRELILKEIELLKRSLSKSEIKFLKDWSVGEYIKYEIKKDLGNNHLKVIKKNPL